jgi:hypothetical protein
MEPSQRTTRHALGLTPQPMRLRRRSKSKKSLRRAATRQDLIAIANNGNIPGVGKSDEITLPWN